MTHQDKPATTSDSELEELLRTVINFKEAAVDKANEESDGFEPFVERANAILDNYIAIAKDKLENLIAQEATKAATQAKISLLTQLAHKPTPTGDDIHPEYTKGFDEMKGKVKFELRRLTADKESKE